MKFLNRALRCMLLGALTVACLTSWAQAPSECTRVTPADKSELEQQRSSLSADISGELSALGSVTVPASLKQKQLLLLEVIFKLDCIRPDVQIDPLSTRSAETARNVMVPIFFATNRSQEAGAPARLVFNGNVAPATTWGKAVVSVPSDRNPGEMNLPTLWKFELKPDLSKHFVLTQVASLGTQSGFANAVLTDLKQANSKSLLLFVHGYRVTFDEAAMRTAQLAHDLRFRGVAMFYSWPSAGNLAGYWHDEETVQLSEQSYSALLDIVGGLPFDSIYVLAHSMGNRLVTTVHNERSKGGTNLKALKELLLAAPDINADIFNQKIAPVFAATGQPRTTIYASNSDVALQASKAIHSFKRLGDANAPVYRRTPFETIDASNVAPVRRAAGHSYVFDSPQVITDLQRLLIQGQAADKRPTLKRVNGDAPIYWTFK